jgi:hypothetical protein
VTDPSPIFADQAKALIADFQHAMQSDAPITPVMLSQLNALLTVATGAYEDRDVLNAQVTETETKLMQLSKDHASLSDQLNAVISYIHGGPKHAA